MVMGAALDTAPSRRQGGPGAIERPGPALLIDTQHHRIVRGIEMDAGHITRLLDEGRVAGQLEGVAQTGLDRENQRCTVLFDTPWARAIRRTLQAPALSGFSCKARLMSSATLSSS